MAAEFKQYDKILAQLPEWKQPKATLLEVAGFPHYENVVSNFLAYYFDIEADHGLKDLFLKSLFIAIGKGDDYQRPEGIRCSREVYTKNNKRIDILIETESYAIAIENKVYHIINNPLEEYHDYLREEHKGKEHIGIVLALHNEQLNDNFFQSLTHHSFGVHLQQQLGLYLNATNSYHASFVSDFIKTLDHLKEPMLMDRNSLNYLANKYDDFKKLNKIIIGFRKASEQKLKSLKKPLDRDKRVEQSKIWYKEDEIQAVLIYHFKEREPTLKVRIQADRISIEIWGVKQLTAVQKTALNGRMEQTKETSPQEFMVVQELPFDVSDNELRSLVLAQMEKLVGIKIKKN